MRSVHAMTPVLILLAVLGVLLPLPSTARPQLSAKPDTIVQRVGPAVHSGGGVAVLQLTLGDGNNSGELARPTMVLPARDGTAWIVDSEGARKAIVRQYSADGRYLRTLGAVGDGPGEYRGANGIAQLPNGKILLRNDANGNVQVYSEAGKYETTWVVGRAYRYPAGGIGGVQTDTRVSSGSGSGSQRLAAA